MEFENLTEGWQQKKLEELIDVIHGYAFKGEDFSDEETSLILLTPGNFAIGGGFKAGKFKYFKEGVEFPQKYILNKNDLLITMTDLSKEGDTLGYPTLVPIIRGKILLHNQRLGKVEIKSTEIDKNYLYYGLCTKLYRDEILASATGTTVKHTAPARILNYTLPYPPLPQQQKIASILGALDDKIKLNNQMNQTLETMAKALFKSWFVDFEPFQDGEFEESELGMIPKGWKVGTYNSEVSIYGGSTPSTTNPEFWDKGSHYWATPKDLSGNTSPVIFETNRKITDKGLKKISSKQLPIGTVLLSSRAPVGYLAIAQVPISINQGFIAMVCGKTISNIYTLLWTQHKMEDIKNRAGGSTFAEISKTNFRTIPVMVPNKDTMAAFNQKVEPLYAQIAMNSRQILSLTAIRDSLLPKLMSGEIEV